MRELSPDIAQQLARQLDKLGPDPNGGAREAAVEATFLVAAVDGVVTPLELSQFAEAVEALIGRDADAGALVQLFAKRLREEGWEKRAGSLGVTLAGSGHAETAYHFAASAAFVDDQIAPTEAEALDVLARAFGISAERAQAILGEVRAELFDT